MFDSFVNSSRFKKQIIINAGILGLIVLAAIIIFSLLADGIKGRAAAVQNYRQKIEELNLAGEAFSVLARDYQITNPYFQEINELLPTKDRLIDFSKQLNGLAEKFGLEANFLFKEELAVDNLPAVSFAMKIDNLSWLKLNGFLAALENSKYFINFETIELSSSGGRDAFSAVFNGRIFIKKEQNP